jgi:hypothetical protein
MNISPGLEASKEEFLLLKMTIYGLLQGARQHYVKLVKALKDNGFQNDTCLRIKNSSNGSVMMTIYMDDCLMIGTDKVIDEVVESLKPYGFIACTLLPEIKRRKGSNTFQQVRLNMWQCQRQ